ncbi:MAG: O-antigen/teichoic acid export membrane protein [Halioglobus sp.]|jgi:O-antigen/teichoic acid export membrane protein
MGVIKKEGIRQSIVTYIGVLIGAANTMYFYPKFFTEEELGLFRFLMNTVLLLLPFISLGVTNLSIRMFPTFRNDKNGHNGLLFFLMVGILVGFTIFLILFFLGFPIFEGFFNDKSSLIQDNWIFIVPLAGLAIVANIYSQYILNFKKVVLPIIFNDLYIKIGLPIIAMLCYFDFLSITEGIYLLLGVYLLRVLSLIAYIIYLKEWHWKPNWKFLKRPLLNEMKIYSLYGIFGSVGGIMATSIDVFMIALLAKNDLKDVGIYSIALFIANVIAVPARSIGRIASPVIAESWKNNDISNIKSIYSKSSIILTTLGLLFLIGIWSSIDDLFLLMPNGEKYAVGKYVIIILGIGKLFDLATGTNSEIIAYSKFFRFNFYAVLVLAILNVVNNFIFIPIYQINGAALATASSLLIFNLCKSAYVYYKIGLQPFSLDTLKVLIIGSLVYVLAMNIAPINIPLLDIVIRSTVIGITFIGSIIYFNISEDLTSLFWQAINKIKSVIK